MAVKSCMSGRSIELCDSGDQVVIRFPFQPSIVTVMRGLSRRRFDQLAKCWSCPLGAIIEVVDTLLPHGFAVGAAARELYAARGGTQKLDAETVAPAGALPPPRCTTMKPSPPTTACSDHVIDSDHPADRRPG